MVSGLPSVSAARIAVTGRQKLSVNLQFHAVIPASAIARFASPNSRAFCTTELCVCWAIVRRTWLYNTTGVPVPGRSYAQKMPCCVWSAVRVVLSLAPSDLTSLNASAYCRLVIAGGGGGANWVPLVSAKGVTSPCPGPTRSASG